MQFELLRLQQPELLHLELELLQLQFELLRLQFELLRLLAELLQLELELLRLQPELLRLQFELLRLQPELHWKQHLRHHVLQNEPDCVGDEAVSHFEGPYEKFRQQVQDAMKCGEQVLEAECVAY